LPYKEDCSRSLLPVVGLFCLYVVGLFCHTRKTRYDRLHQWSGAAAGFRGPQESVKAVVWQTVFAGHCCHVNRTLLTLVRTSVLRSCASTRGDSRRLTLRRSLNMAQGSLTWPLARCASLYYVILYSTLIMRVVNIDGTMVLYSTSTWPLARCASLYYAVQYYTVVF